MAVTTRHTAECERCGLTDELAEPIAPAGWRAVTGSRSARLLCPRCIRDLDRFLEHLPAEA